MTIINELTKQQDMQDSKCKNITCKNTLKIINHHLENRVLPDSPIFAHRNASNVPDHNTPDALLVTLQMFLTITLPTLSP